MVSFSGTPALKDQTSSVIGARNAPGFMKLRQPWESTVSHTCVPNPLVAVVVYKAPTPHAGDPDELIACDIVVGGKTLPRADQVLKLSAGSGKPVTK